MAMIDFDGFCARSGSFLGLDPGTKTLGVAMSDRTGLIASPLITLQRCKPQADVQSLWKVYQAHHGQALVVGLPVNMDGSYGRRAQSVQDFCQFMLKITNMDIFFWDERLSTQAVMRTLLAADMSRKKRAVQVDKLAATYILQGALDARYRHRAKG